MDNLWITFSQLARVGDRWYLTIMVTILPPTIDPQTFGPFPTDSYTDSVRVSLGKRTSVLPIREYRTILANLTESDATLSRFPANLAYSLWYYGDAAIACESARLGDIRMLAILVSSRVRRVIGKGIVRVVHSKGRLGYKEYPIHTESKQDKLDIVQSIIANRLAMIREYPCKSIPASAIYWGDSGIVDRSMGESPIVHRTDTGRNARTYPDIQRLILALDRSMHNKAQTPTGGYWMEWVTELSTWRKVKVSANRASVLRQELEYATNNGTLSSFRYRWQGTHTNNMKQYLTDPVLRESASELIPNMQDFIDTLTDGELNLFRLLYGAYVRCDVNGHYLTSHPYYRTIQEKLTEWTGSAD